MLANVSTPTVSRFEGGEKDIQLSSAFNLLRILGMTDERILAFEEGREVYDDSRMAVIFFALDDTKRIQCAISREALTDFFKVTSSTSRGFLEAFRKNRHAIQHRAFMKYLAGQWEPDHAVFIQSCDLE